MRAVSSTGGPLCLCSALCYTWGTSRRLAAGLGPVGGAPAKIQLQSPSMNGIAEVKGNEHRCIARHGWKKAVKPCKGTPAIEWYSYRVDTQAVPKPTARDVFRTSSTGLAFDAKACVIRGATWPALADATHPKRRARGMRQTTPPPHTRHVARADAICLTRSSIQRRQRCRSG